MSDHEEPPRATIRFAGDELRRTLALVGWDRDGDTELHFVNGALLARNEKSDGFVRQAPVPLVDGAGDPVGFRVSSERLRALVQIGRELQLGIVARDGYSCHVGITSSDHDSNGLDWECQRIPAENRTEQGKMLRGAVLRELLRVVEPFAHDRQRSCLEPTEHVDVVEMTRHGLVCHSPEDEWVCFEAQGLTDTPWTIPVANLADVRRLTRKWKSFCVGVDDDRSWIADGDGAVVSWCTPVPLDFGVDADSHEPDLDHFVATVSGKKLRSTLGSMVSRLPSSDCSVVLRISPLERSMAFATTYQGATYHTFVPVHVERNRLDGDVEARFALGMLKKVLTGTKARSVQLRLQLHEGGSRRKTWQLRSVDSYSLGSQEQTPDSKGSIQPVLCRVTRMASSLSRQRDRTVG